MLMGLLNILDGFFKDGIGFVSVLYFKRIGNDIKSDIDISRLNNEKNTGFVK